MHGDHLLHCRLFCFTFGVITEYPRLVTIYNAVQKVELFFSSFKIYADFDLFYFLITHHNIWQHFCAHVSCTQIFDQNLADLLRLASQPPVNCQTVINAHKRLKIFNVFIGFWLNEYQTIVHVILTAQKTSMPLTREHNTLFFHHQHTSTPRTFLLQIVRFD